MGEKSFSSNLRRVMQTKGMTQVALARRSGIKQQLISSYIRKSKMARYPSLKNLMRLAKALECPVDDLLGLSSESQQSEAKRRKTFSDLARQLGEAFDRLPNNDWRREAVKHLLLGDSE